MFDDLLGKSQFIKTLSETGMTKTEALEKWGLVERAAVLVFLKKVGKSLNEEEMKSLVGNINIDGPDDESKKKLFESLEKYVTDNVEKVRQMNIKVDVDEIAEFLTINKGK